MSLFILMSLLVYRYEVRVETSMGTTRSDVVSQRVGTGLFPGKNTFITLNLNSHLFSDMISKIIFALKWLVGYIMGILLLNTN